MKKNLLIFLIPLFVAASAYGQTVSFLKENVEMKLDASHITVSGEYNFRNNHGTVANKTMFFPLPLATGELKMDSFSVYDVSGQSYIRNVRKLPAGLFFQLNFNGQEQKKIRIFYRMDHDGRTVRYLVKTQIGYWNKALSQGIYTLQVDDSAIIIDSTSFKPDDILANDTRITHFWRKTNFDPDKELEIWFHKQKQE